MFTNNIPSTDTCMPISVSARGPMMPWRPYTMFRRLRPTRFRHNDAKRKAVPLGASTFVRWWASIISTSKPGPNKLPDTEGLKHYIDTDTHIRSKKTWEVTQMDFLLLCWRKSCGPND